MCDVTPSSESVKALTKKSKWRLQWIKAPPEETMKIYKWLSWSRA